MNHERPDAVYLAGTTVDVLESTSLPGNKSYELINLSSSIKQ
jgi:hypothetical protein